MCWLDVLAVCGIATGVLSISVRRGRAPHHFAPGALIPAQAAWLTVCPAGTHAHQHPGNCPPIDVATIVTTGQNRPSQQGWHPIPQPGGVHAQPAVRVSVTHSGPHAGASKVHALELGAMCEVLRGSVRQVPAAVKAHPLELRALREVPCGSVRQSPAASKVHAVW